MAEKKNSVLAFITFAIGAIASLAYAYLIGPAFIALALVGVILVVYALFVGPAFIADLDLIFIPVLVLGILVLGAFAYLAYAQVRRKLEKRKPSLLDRRVSSYNAAKALTVTADAAKVKADNLAAAYAVFVGPAIKADDLAAALAAKAAFARALTTKELADAALAEHASSSGAKTEAGYYTYRAEQIAISDKIVSLKSELRNAEADLKATRANYFKAIRAAKIVFIITFMRNQLRKTRKI